MKRRDLLELVGGNVAGPSAGHLPNVKLLTHENESVRFYDDLVRGRIVMINMMYAQCEGICPGMTQNLRKVQQLLGDRVGKDIFMYSITLQPEQDNPRALAGYAKMYGVAPGWKFLTGEPEAVALVRRKLGFSDPDPKRDADKSQHTGLVRYGNETLDRWAACPALSNPAQIVRSVLWMVPSAAT